MANGTERIRTVVVALRIFTRLDESGIKQVSLKEGIDIVFSLLQHRLGVRNDNVTINVKREYEDLPSIACHAEQLNQVIFNLCNAIDAVEEKIKKGTYHDVVPEISVNAHLLSGAEISGGLNMRR